MIPNTLIPPLPTQTQLETTENLPALVLAHYRAIFHSALTRGEARYFILPYTLLGSTIIPIIYLSIPHKNRPWLYQARWAVAALIVAMNFDLLRNGTSSANMAIAYVTGLVASWGTIWWLTILLVLEPQFEAARVQRRRRRGELVCDGEKRSEAIDESVAAVEVEYEHYWQYYPSGGSLFERLGWIFDLMGSLRGVGWNFATSTTPHPPPPSPQSPLVNLPLTPQSTPTGTTRSKTYSNFTLTRLSTILISFLTLDLCTLLARQDPYFTLGKSYPPSTLPPFLASLPPHILSLLRSVTALAAILSGLQFYLNLSHLFTCLFGLAPLWQHPTPFGSFTKNVLDRGLAGFWGGFWHQTFRVGFTAPVVFFERRGYLGGWHPYVKRVLTLLVAFTLSGSIHAAGGWTSIPEGTSIWVPFVFYWLSFVGIVIQSVFCGWLFPTQIRTLPRWVRRVGNGVFVLAWLHGTRWIFIDDMCASGLFLFEPVPFSVLRLLRVVEPLKGDEGWWRWDGGFFKWVWGVDGRWWESGWRV